MSVVDQGPPVERGTPDLASVPALLREGYAVFDDRLRLVACNDRFTALGGYPPGLTRPGAAYADIARFDAARDPASGDLAAAAAERVARLARREAFARDERRNDGTMLSVSATPLSGGAMLVSTFDMSERAAVER
jgi:PAS domain-containing protein